METTKFKKLIKEAVREAIQEELKDILLEAVKSPKATVVTESYVPQNTYQNTYAQPQVSQPKQLTAAERKSMFSGIIEEMQHGGAATTKNVPFRPQGPVDSINGKLPEGEVDLSQIMGLMNNR